MSATRVPVLLNSLSGSAARVRAALSKDGRVELLDVEPMQLPDVVRSQAEAGASRVIVCGGDGTLSAVLGAAAGAGVEVGVIPGGTLNHFARDYGIPVDPAAALDVALTSPARPVDLGCVNGHPMLNTSSVGVYVDFVRRRELLERRVRYRVASVGAAFSVWHDPRALAVELRTADGAQRRLETPLVFVGVQERALARGALGERRPGGARALHILVVNEKRPLRIRSLVFRALVRGIDGLIHDDEVSSYLTSEAVVSGAWRGDTIAVDGELLTVRSPLRYRLVPDAVMVVRP